MLIAERLSTKSLENRRDMQGKVFSFIYGSFTRYILHKPIIARKHKSAWSL